MANLLHSGDLNTLKLGQTLLTRFRKIEGGFVQMELAEVKEGSRGLSAAFVFNQSITDLVETLHVERGNQLHLLM